MTNDFEIDLNRTVTIIICGLSMIPYLLYIVYLIITKSKYTLSTFFHFQLCLSCFIYNISFFIPLVKTNPSLCKLQSILNVFSDLSGMSISTVIVLLAQMNFVNSSDLNQKRRIYLILSFIFCWLIPILLGILSLFYSGTNDYSAFCWLNNKIIISVFFSIRLIHYIVFYICVNRLRRKLNLIKDKLNNEFVRYYVNIIRKYIIVITTTFIIFIMHSSMDLITFLSTLFITEGIHINNYIWLVVGSLHCLTYPIVVIVFDFNKQVIRELLCKSDNKIESDYLNMTINNESEFKLSNDERESQMELLGH